MTTASVPILSEYFEDPIVSVDVRGTVEGQPDFGRPFSALLVNVVNVGTVDLIGSHVVFCGELNNPTDNHDAIAHFTTEDLTVVRVSDQISAYYRITEGFNIRGDDPTFELICSLQFDSTDGAYSTRQEFTIRPTGEGRFVGRLPARRPS